MIWSKNKCPSFGRNSKWKSVCCGGHGENNSSAFPGVATSIVSFLIWACSVYAFVLVSAGRTFWIILLSCLPELLIQHVNTHTMQTLAHTATKSTVHVHHTLESLTYQTYEKNYTHSYYTFTVTAKLSPSRYFTDEYISWNFMTLMLRKRSLGKKKEINENNLWFPLSCHTHIESETVHLPKNESMGLDGMWLAFFHPLPADSYVMCDHFSSVAGYFFHCHDILTLEKPAACTGACMFM